MISAPYPGAITPTPSSGGGSSAQSAELESNDDTLTLTLSTPLAPGESKYIEITTRLNGAFNPDFYIYTNNGISNFNCRLTGSTSTTSTSPRVGRISSGSDGMEVTISGMIGLTVDGNVVGRFSYNSDNLSYYGDSYIFQTTTSTEISSIVFSHNNAGAEANGLSAGTRIRAL